MPRPCGPVDPVARSARRVTRTRRHAFAGQGREGHGRPGRTERTERFDVFRSVPIRFSPSRFDGRHACGGERRRRGVGGHDHGRTPYGGAARAPVRAVRSDAVHCEAVRFEYVRPECVRSECVRPVYVRSGYVRSTPVRPGVGRRGGGLEFHPSARRRRAPAATGGLGPFPGHAADHGRHAGEGAREGAGPVATAPDIGLRGPAPFTGPCGPASYDGHRDPA